MNADQKKKLNSIIARCVKRKLSCLDLSGSELPVPVGDDGIRYLCERLDTLTHVKKLDLNGGRIGRDGIRALCECSSLLPNLVTLGINGAALGDAGFGELGGLLAAFPRLRHLSARMCEQDSSIEAMQAWGERMPPGGALAELHLGENEFHDETIRGLWLFVAPRMPGLKQLLLEDNAFGPYGVSYLARCAEYWPFLEDLDLAGNYVFSEGMSILSDSDWPSLRRLDLASADIGTSGAVALADRSHRMPRLENLIVPGCGIEDRGMRALISALRRDPWRTSMTTIVAHQNATQLLPDEVLWSGDAQKWREYGDTLPPTVHELKIVSNKRGRSKRLASDAAKGILALLDTCLEWPTETISERKLYASRLLKDKRSELGLGETVSQSTIHNHLAYLAKACGMPSIVELGSKRQSSRLRPGAREKLLALRGDLVVRVKRDEDRT